MAVAIRLVLVLVFPKLMDTNQACPYVSLDRVSVCEGND
ncbi:MAG: hypothetical protein ACI8T1_001257 [Verrucomicrobiales bacterium]|jgi:hypothetical protein